MVTLLVEFGLVLICDFLLEVDNLVIVRLNNGNQEIEHDNQEEKCLEVPGDPNQENLDRFVDAIFSSSEGIISRQAHFTNGISKSNEQYNNEIWDFLDISCLWIGFCFEYRVNHRGDDQEEHIRDQKRNQVDYAILNHGHKEAIFFKDSDKEQKLDHGKCEEQKS